MKTVWDVPFRYIVMTFLILLALGVLWYIREVFQPLMTAGLMAYFLSPAVNFLVMRARIRRKLAANLIYFTVLAILIATATVYGRYHYAVDAVAGLAVACVARVALGYRTRRRRRA